MSGGAAFASVKDLKELLERSVSTKTMLDEATETTVDSDVHDSASSSSNLPQDPMRRELLIKSIDVSVYSKWRPFRLPWCTKNIQRQPTQHFPSSLDISEGSSVAGGLHSPPSLAELSSTIFGAPAASVALQLTNAPPQTERHRYFVPIVIGRTLIESKALHSALLQCNCIAAASSSSADERDPQGEEVLINSSDSMTMMLSAPIVEEIMSLAMVQRTDVGAVVLAATSEVVDRPVPFGSGPRRYVHGALAIALAELFRCLHPKFDEGTLDSVISSTIITAQYEDNGTSRAYYVSQKRNRFCLALLRSHKNTFGQLYVTFGSIKYRCYSNDCCKQCLRVPWENEANSASSSAWWRDGTGPRFERMKELRAILFPPLSDDELHRRYSALTSTSSGASLSSIQME